MRFTVGKSGARTVLFRAGRTLPGACRAGVVQYHSSFGHCCRASAAHEIQDVDSETSHTARMDSGPSGEHRGRERPYDSTSGARPAGEFGDSPSVLVLFAVVLVAVFLKKARQLKPTERWPLKVRATVLSAPEQVLYRRLVQSLPQHLVFAQVQLSRFLEVERGASRQAWFNRSAGVTLVRWRVSAMPDEAAIRTALIQTATHPSVARS